MTPKLSGALPASLIALATFLAAPAANAQAEEVKEKKPLYTYVSFFAFPRAKWAELAAPRLRS